MATVVNYEAMNALASGLIAKMGRAALLLADAGDIPVTAMLVDFGRAERDGSLIDTDDRRAFIAAVPGLAMPDPELHRLQIDGRVFRIVTTRAVNPGGTILYYDCQVRF